MTSLEMDIEKTVLGDLINIAEAKIELNPVDFIMRGNVEHMKNLQVDLDDY